MPFCNVRSVPRFRNIEPHRYHRSDTGVSHPFPIVEVESAGAGGAGVSVSSTMMSRVETMNTDFRSFALLSMRDIAQLTSYEADVIHLKLVQVCIKLFLLCVCVRMYVFMK